LSFSAALRAGTGGLSARPGGSLAIRVSGKGGLPEGAKDDGAWHEVKLDLKAMLDKASGKTGPYTIGDILFGNFGGDANPAAYEVKDVVLRRG